MVHIINGEIVQDDDPRVRARFQPAAGATPPPGRGPTPAAAGGPQVPPAAAAASPLDGLARQVGLEGTVQLPAVPVVGLPARAVAKIHLALAALLVALLGWRALAFLAFAYFVSSQPAAGAPRAAPRPGPGAPRPQRGGIAGL